MNKSRWIKCTDDIYFLTESIVTVDNDLYLLGFYYRDMEQDINIGPFNTLLQAMNNQYIKIMECV